MRKRFLIVEPGQGPEVCTQGSSGTTAAAGERLIAPPGWQSEPMGDRDRTRLHEITIDRGRRIRLMAGPIDNTLDELDNQLVELKREVARLEEFRRQLGATDKSATVASESASRTSAAPRSLP
jgi:hypothetical protein